MTRKILLFRALNFSRPGDDAHGRSLFHVFALDRGRDLFSYENKKAVGRDELKVLIRH